MLDLGPKMLKVLEALVSNIDEDVPLGCVTRHLIDALGRRVLRYCAWQGTMSRSGPRAPANILPLETFLLG